MATGYRHRLSIAAVILATLLLLRYLSISSKTPYFGSSTSAYHTPAAHSSSDHNQPAEEHVSSPDVGSVPNPSPSIERPKTPPPRCTVTKISMLYGAHRFSQLEEALESHRRHSERWGCGFESLDRDVSSRKLYSKQYFLLSILLRELAKPKDERKKWLMWVDADSILVNPALSPEVFLPPEHLENVYALVTADHNGLNAGVFYLKVHTSSLDLLTQTAAYPLQHPEEDLGWFGEQAAMAKVINSTLEADAAGSRRSGIVWVPRKWFNTYQLESGFEGERGHFLVHFAGLGETRISHMQNWLNELETQQANWEVPLEQSLYKTAIADFWHGYQANLTSHA